MQNIFWSISYDLNPEFCCKKDKLYLGRLHALCLTASDPPVAGLKIKTAFSISHNIWGLVDII